MRGLCLDAGALIAVERGSRRVLRLLELALESGRSVHVPVPVVAQVWRGGSRQARLARFLRLDDVNFAELDLLAARAVGELCATTGTEDIVDAHVAMHAKRFGLAVVTSDAKDPTALSGDLEIIAV